MAGEMVFTAVSTFMVVPHAYVAVIFVKILNILIRSQISVDPQYTTSKGCSDLIVSHDPG